MINLGKRTRGRTDQLLEFVPRSQLIQHIAAGWSVMGGVSANDYAVLMRPPTPMKLPAVEALHCVATTESR